MEDANDVSSSPGFGRLEAARSSPPPDASRAPLSSSSSSAPDPPPHRTSTSSSSSGNVPRPRRTSSSAPDPPPHGTSTPPSSAPDPPPRRTCTPLAVLEPSASASGEWSKPGDLKIEVHLVTRDGYDTVELTLQSSQTIQDIKEYFEKDRGRDVCSAENMVVYHDGTKLPSMTILETLDLKNWNDILLTYEEDTSQLTCNLAPAQEGMVDDGLMRSIDYISWETTNVDNLGSWSYEYEVSPATQEAVEHMVNHFDGTTTPDYDYRSTIGQSDIADISTAVGENPIGIIQTAPPSTAETPSLETAFPTSEIPSETALLAAGTSTAAEASENLATQICSQVLNGRLLIPVTAADFSDRLLSNNQLHGFKTVHGLINEINRGAPRWITKKQALGLLYNAEIFAISDVQEDDKKDGLSCIIDSTKCQISNSLGGYSVATNVQSSEKWIGIMKEKGVEMEWFEVRGKFWSRRRLVLSGGDGVFHLLQWKQHQNTEKADAAARVSTLGENTMQELRHGISDTATGASTLGERTRGLGEEVSVDARGGGFDEVRAMIKDLQTAVCSQFKEFQTTVSSQLSQFESQIQRIDTRVQAIEQHRSSTDTLGSRQDSRQSSSSASQLPLSDD